MTEKDKLTTQEQLEAIDYLISCLDKGKTIAIADYLGRNKVGWGLMYVPGSTRPGVLAPFRKFLEREHARLVNEYRHSKEENDKEVFTKFLCGECKKVIKNEDGHVSLALCWPCIKKLVRDNDSKHRGNVTSGEAIIKCDGEPDVFPVQWSEEEETA